MSFSKHPTSSDSSLAVIASNDNENDKPNGPRLPIALRPKLPPRRLSCEESESEASANLQSNLPMITQEALLQKSAPSSDTSTNPKTHQMANRNDAYSQSSIKAESNLEKILPSIDQNFSQSHTQASRRLQNTKDHNNIHKMERMIIPGKI